MGKLLQDMRREFDRGQADAVQASGSGRLSTRNAFRIQLSAYWPAALATLLGAVAVWRLAHWTPWTAFGGGLVLGIAVLLLVSRWINRRLDLAPLHDPGLAADERALDSKS